MAESAATGSFPVGTAVRKSSANTRTWTVTFPVASVWTSSVTVVCMGCSRPVATDRASKTDQGIVMLPRTPGDGHLPGDEHDHRGHREHPETIRGRRRVGASHDGERAVEPDEA